jgi:hypothetical protein
MSTTKYIVDNKSEQTINGEPILRPYKVFTCRIHQSGNENESFLSSGTLEIGRTYWIKADPGLVGDDDFSNCGDNQNTPDRRFIAIAETPTNWSNGSTLVTQDGAPVVNILENSLVEPFYFEYTTDGDYLIKSYDPLFTADKTITLFGRMSDSGLTATSDFKIEYDNDSQMRLITSKGNDELGGYCIEIRVYN